MAVTVVCCYVERLHPSGRYDRNEVLVVFMAVASDVVRCCMYDFS